MSEVQKIAEHFIASSIEVVGSPVWDHENTRYLVFVAITVDDDGKQVPSNYKLSLVEKQAERTFGEVTIILANRGDEDIANSIKSLLIRRFGEDIRNVFSRIEGGKVTVWVETKGATSNNTTNDMMSPVSGMIKQFGLELRSFINTSELNLPSETVCIATVRKLAPTLPLDVIKELHQRGFEVPGEEWLVRILDKWRKRGLIHRQSSGAYILTIRGLRDLGSGKNRRSPDVVRSLAMARRGQ